MENKETERAKELLDLRGAKCAIVCGDYEWTSAASGIAPLVAVAESGDDLRGCAAADKIAGKAAALLYAYVGAGEVFAEVMSVAARQVLERYGIKYGYVVLTDYIVNRKGDGMCPMEEAVKDCEDPREALVLLRRKLNSLSS